MIFSFQTFHASIINKEDYIATIATLYQNFKLFLHMSYARQRNVDKSADIIWISTVHAPIAFA